MISFSSSNNEIELVGYRSWDFDQSVNVSELEGKVGNLYYDYVLSTWNSYLVKKITKSYVVFFGHSPEYHYIFCINTTLLQNFVENGSVILK